jgi:hypothetical protein
MATATFGMGCFRAAATEIAPAGRFWRAPEKDRVDLARRQSAAAA